jgi:hypothetical protein
VIGVPKSEALFLALNGVDLTFELLLLVAPAQRKQVLGFLSDLLANTASHKYVYEWDSPPGAKLPGVDGGVSAGLAAGGATIGDRTGAISPLSSVGGSHADESSSAANGGFTALELLLSLWPSPSLLERNEKHVQGHLRYKSGASVGDGATPLSPSIVVPEEDSDMEEDEASPRSQRFRYKQLRAEREERENATREERYASSVALQARAAASLPRVSTNQHLKPCLYAIFSRLGLDGVTEDGDDDPHAVSPFVARATPVQRATLFEIARFVDTMRAATLASIEQRLREEGVSVVASDAEFLSQNRAHLDSLTDGATRFEAHMWGAHQAAERAAIDAYLHAITDRKESNEQFLLANARRARKQTMRRRLLYKEMRQQMLRNSAAPTQTPPSGASDSAAVSKPASAAPAARNKDFATEQKMQSDAQIAHEAAAAEQQQRAEDEEDVELENRLLQELESELPTSSDPIELAASASELPAEDDEAELDETDASAAAAGDDAAEQRQERKYDTPSPPKSKAGSHTSSRSKLITTMAPEAEAAMIAARRAQKQQQQAVAEALQSQAVGNAAAASQRSLMTTNRTSTSARPTKGK